MEQIKNENQIQDKNQNTVTFIDARVALSRDGQFILHFFSDGTIMRKSVSLYKHVMKINYERKNGEKVAFA